MSALSRWFGAVGIILSINLMSAPAQAAFNFTSQARSVSAGISIGGSQPAGPTINAADFGLFDRTASTTYPLPNGGSVSQHQRSELLPSLITIVGDFSGMVPGAAGTGHITGRSNADVTFTVPATTEVDLTAQVNFNAPNDIPGSVTLTGPNTSVSWYVASTPGPPGAPWPAGGHAQHLVLDPGSYTLHALLNSDRVGTQPIFQNFVSSFNVALAIPESASLALVAPLLATFLRRRRHCVQRGAGRSSAR